MPFYQIKEKQKIPVTIDTIWDFISSPENLKHITPEYMGFEILDKYIPDKMYPGMIISYKLSPVPGIKIKWVTEITHIKEKEYFVDEQRVGPYSMWHHQHKVEKIEKGVLMIDLLTYKPPYGILGKPINYFIINKQLRKIFNYRKAAIEKKFGKF